MASLFRLVSGFLSAIATPLDSGGYERPELHRQFAALL
jgi:hypothetical protein